VSIRLKEWLARLAEISANFALPGLGGLIFDRSHWKNAFWQMVLSASGMILAIAGAAVFLSVFVDLSGLRLDEEYISNVIQKPEEVYKILLGVAGVILGGVLVLGGFLWSLDNAMKRWRKIKILPAEDPDTTKEK